MPNPCLAAHAVGIGQRFAAGTSGINHLAAAIADAAGIQGAGSAAGASGIKDSASWAAGASRVNHSRGAASQLGVDSATGTARRHLSVGEKHTNHYASSKV